MNGELRKGLRTWIEIDKKAIKSNYNAFRKLISKDCKICAVVKSNAYGHGLVDFSKEVSSLGVDWLAVDSIIEGLRLRREGIKIPVLVLGYTLPEMIDEASKNDISITVSHFESLSFIAKSKFDKKIKVHIKIDSGMHRQGFVEKDIKKVIEILKKNKNKIEVEGLYTHFASAKNPAFPDKTNKQISIFKKWVNDFRSAGLTPLVHAAATGGTIIFPEAHFDMVRIGIGMYGLWPSVEAKKFGSKNIKLTPVLSWKTLVGEIKILDKGEGLGYDFTEKLGRKSKIAICPIGYWHGYPRALSSIGEVLVRGKKAKVIGRVAMDMIGIDITDIAGVKILDEAVIIGKSGGESVRAEDIAGTIDASYYEIITRINPLIKKIYI